ncbi:unnamed protein product [Sphagnum balticum]
MAAGQSVNQEMSNTPGSGIGSIGAGASDTTNGASDGGQAGDFSSAQDLKNMANTNALNNSTGFANAESNGSSGNGIFGSLGDWINKNPSLALKLGIAGGGGLLAAGASLIGPKSKGVLSSPQYTTPYSQPTSNYTLLNNTASKGYQPTPQFANYNPITSVSGNSGLYNFYNPSANTGQNA